MTFTVDFSQEFLKQYPQFDQQQKQCIGEFASLVKAHGLDQTKLRGKLTASWLNASAADHQYAYQNNLWHYHAGYPSYRQNPNGPDTSEWVIHFQWFYNSTHIDIVDFYAHYKAWPKRGFYLPPRDALKP
ncbi:MAG TPA: hypothetical protein VHA82_04000 [Ramlibacter sp.]|uniref:hypothetical protein n=1 Tax=Ramlibacter sp. TaxID=1917967 RepID=UPI002B688FD5|nr:hypothetical protein [Ramlibacter sp.]HVZ42952.1 hypothetical protein [Ramlibacter sp.]